ncbi:hypothetical protein [Okeania sp. SIO2B3]|uniref:hypothetical protein n=1 Tax=Okeania sp. SIO2B3 TaxID=2607784 RepID=UPI003448EB7D
MIFVEELDLRTWAEGMLGKHTLDAGFGQFFKPFGLGMQETRKNFSCFSLKGEALNLNYSVKKTCLSVNINVLNVTTQSTGM